MDTFTTLITQFSLGLLGVFLYNLIAFKDQLSHTKDMGKGIFWKAIWVESRWLWIWCVAMILTISGVIAIEPGISEAISTLTGLDVGESKAAFLTLGFGIAGGVDSKK